MIDLSKFCSNDETRLSISKPFSIGGYTYATNGHICIRVPLLSDAEQAQDGKHPLSAKDLFKEISNVEFESMVNLQTPEEIILEEDCESCNHTECPSCFCQDGCMDCEGQGKVIKSIFDCTVIGEVPFDSYYLRLIKELPEPEFVKNPKPLAIANFKFSGGEGALMPLRSITQITRIKPLIKEDKKNETKNNNS